MPAVARIQQAVSLRVEFRNIRMRRRLQRREPLQRENADGYGRMNDDRET